MGSFYWGYGTTSQKAKTQLEKSFNFSFEPLRRRKKTILNHSKSHEFN